MDSDDVPDDPSIDISAIVDAWIAYSQHGTVLNALNELINESPEEAWPLVREIIHRERQYRLAADAARRLLRPLLCRHGSLVIDAIERDAEDSVVLRRILGGLPRKASEMAPEIKARVLQVAETTTDHDVFSTPTHTSTLAAENERLVNAWFARDDAFWGWDKVQDLIRKDPKLAWQIIGRLVEAAPSDDVLGHIGAGPLEELLVHHGMQFISRIETASRVDPHFRRCLTAVWPSDIPKAVWARVVVAREGASE